MNNKKRVYIKYLIILSIFIILMHKTLAIEQADNYNNYNKLTLDFNIEGKFKIAGKESESKVAEITSQLTFFPQTDNLQEINSLETYSTPKSQISKDTEKIQFKWEEPQEKNFKFGLNSEITVNNALMIIDKKIQFPTNEIETTYTKASEFIDITPEIREKAEEIAKGEDDLYVVSFKAASWVQQNIKYDLSTLTEEIVQKSSWVLRNREGVCDELTNLFISIMRSLGVQARFVSGMAYTNLDHKWGAHAWAEVYFPDKGWVPFDITYGEFGWINPTHIKLKINKDSGDPAVKYSWKSINAMIEDKTINLSTKLIKKGNVISSPLELKIIPLVGSSGPGSYIPLELEIKNNNNHYISSQFTVTKSLNLTENNIKFAILKPGETKKLFWIAKTQEKIEDDYIYLSTIEIEDQFKTSAIMNISYSNEGEIISLEEAKKIIEETYQEKETRITSNKLTIKCSGARTIIKDESSEILCKLKNIGNTRLEELNVCQLDNCQKAELSIAEEQTITFIPQNLKLGMQSIVIEASNKEIKASDLITLEVLEDPGLKIININYPETLDYKDNSNITLVMTTKTPVKDINLKINDQNIMNLEKIESSEKIIIATKGKDLFNKKEMTVSITFKDLNEKEYTIESQYPLKVINIPWYMEFLNFIGLV